MAGDTAIFCKDIELRIDPDPFCTPYQKPPMNKNERSKTPLKPGASLKWVYGHYYSNILNFFTSETNFSNDLLIVDEY